MRQKNHSKSQRHQRYYHSIPTDLETFPFIGSIEFKRFLQIFAKNAINGGGPPGSAITRAGARNDSYSF